MKKLILTLLAFLPLTAFCQTQWQTACIETTNRLRQHHNRQKSVYDYQKRKNVQTLRQDSVCRKLGRHKNSNRRKLAGYENKICRQLG